MSLPRTRWRRAGNANDENPIETAPISIERLTDFFEDSFRALRPEKLGASILALCRESWGIAPPLDWNKVSPAEEQKND